jgi:hypothetical protein
LVCARLVAPGTTSASAVATAARLATPVSLRTTLHNIGIADYLPTNWQNFYLTAS